MKKIRMLINLSWEFSAKYYLLIILLSVLSGSQMLLSLYIPAKFVEVIVSGSVDSYTICLMWIIVITKFLFHYIINYVESRLDIEKTYVKDMMNLKMSKKIMTISYSKIETPYFLNLRQQAIYAIETQDALANILYVCANLIRKLAVTIELMVVVGVFSKFMLGIILLFNGLLLICYVILKKYEISFSKKFSEYSRKFSYYLGLCFEEALQKDIRLYDMDELLTNKVRLENKNVLEYQKKYHAKRGKYNGLVSAFVILQTAISYVYVIYRTFMDNENKLLSYGEFTFYINTILNLFSSIREVIYDFVNISQMFSYLNPFFEFMMIEEEEHLYGKIKLSNIINCLEFRNVSFSYPGLEGEVLTDISFKVAEGEKISIVGLNGAGKTTIVKLICRLYKPTKGNIFINGIDIWEYDELSYKRGITTVFQDYKMFALSIAENISCSSETCFANIKQRLFDVNIDYLLTKYPKGINTELDKAYEDEGIDLSGGEKQKLAIARALNKGGDIFILDEPTSSLDPKAEAEIFEQFEHLVENKMTFYVSHRMSSSRLCDKILVIDKGRLLQFGNHNELIKQIDGLYYKMFMAQAWNYVDEVKINKKT